jgi:FkbM family methyltransferase
VERPGGVAALVNAMGTYDFNNMHFVKGLLSRLKGVFVDVGANIGAYTLIASEITEAMVVSIEPHPRTFASLTENIRLNRRYNVTCVNAALSARDGEVQLTDEAQPELNRVVQTRDAGGVVRVQSRRFDRVCRVLQVVPDIVKIDVEGHQQKVLDGFGEYRQTVKVILVEGGEDEGVKNWMLDGGYLGPFFVHFKRRMLSERQQARPEDPVYVRRDFVPELCGARLRDGVLDLSYFLPQCAADDPRGVVQWQ